VAHPGLVPIAREQFDVLDADHQIGEQRDDVHITASELLAVPAEPSISEQGVRTNINVGIQYLESWLAGQGCVPINNLMEDAATAEISRSQVWQWLHNDIHLADGPQVTRELVDRIIDEELAKIAESFGDAYDEAKFAEAVGLFKDVALADDYAEFLTLPAYEHMP
jgi:malate synthase